jgi:uncharacterized integral membrane protein
MNQPSFLINPFRVKGVQEVRMKHVYVAVTGTVFIFIFIFIFVSSSMFSLSYLHQCNLLGRIVLILIEALHDRILSTISI